MVLGLLALPRTAVAADPLADAQAHVTAAINKANDATAAYQNAQSRYYSLQDQVAAGQKKVAGLQAEQKALVKLAQMRALVAYKGGSLELNDFMGFGDDVMESARRATLLDRVNARGNAAIAQLTVVNDELRARQKELNSQLDDARTSLSDMKKQSQAATNAVAESQKAVETLKARLAAEKRQAELARRLKEAQAAARARQAQNVSTGGGGGGGGPASGPNEGPGQVIATGPWVCPVQGPVSFRNDWGEPRGGGTRGHRGTDMFSPGGTPTVAPTDGTVFFQDDTLGGHSWYVTDAQNNTYYGTHLMNTVGGARSVKAGEILGHVGNSGDAAGGPTHLHFEIRRGGPNGTKVNPYPTLAAHC
jgi:murein DD-endopeptidase MepM/ murein hydrolase activator NlpD